MVFNCHFISPFIHLLFIFFPRDVEVTVIAMWYLALLIWKSHARLIFTLCVVCACECASAYAHVGLCRGQRRGPQCLPILFSSGTRSSPVCLGWLPASSRGPRCLSPNARVLGRHSHSWLICGCWGQQLRPLCSGTHSSLPSHLPRPVFVLWESLFSKFFWLLGIGSFKTEQHKMVIGPKEWMSSANISGPVTTPSRSSYRGSFCFLLMRRCSRKCASRSITYSTEE